MKVKTIGKGLAQGTLFILLLWGGHISAQTFSSGSTGADGSLNPTSNTTVTLPPDGVLHYTAVNIPSGVTVTFVKNAANTPVTMLATGDVTIAGTININGSNGGAPSTTLDFIPGGAPGPGGFIGGQSGSRGLTNRDGSGGQGPGGGTPNTANGGEGGTYGAPSSFVSLIPLFGGSGGGGMVGANSSQTGPSGGGGGGAIMIASTTKVTVTGTIRANGGGGGFQLFLGCSGFGGSGSGGSIRLVAPEITNSGTLESKGGVPTNGSTCNNGGDGRIRLEAFSYGTVLPTDPVSSISFTPGPINSSSTPALVNLPVLTISDVGGLASPSTPGGSFTTADISLPTGTTNPVPVTLSAANVPLGTVFTVMLIPQFGAPTSINSTASSGTFESSTASANVNFPTGKTSVLNAYASFTLPQTASNPFPVFVEGEKVEKIKVAAVYGGDSSIYLITESGREVPYRLGMQ